MNKEYKSLNQGAWQNGVCGVEYPDGGIDPSAFNKTENLKINKAEKKHSSHLKNRLTSKSFIFHFFTSFIFRNAFQSRYISLNRCIS